MSPRLGVRIVALALQLLAVTAGSASADYDAARRFLDLTPDPIERSPRLLGMGRLTWVGRDPHHQINLWDFAGNPTGVFGDDSVSTFELRPSTASADAKRTEPESGVAQLERQQLGAREMRLGFELWRRTDHTVYGGIGSLSSLRMDVPFDEHVERRSKFGVPAVMGLIGGDLPFLGDPSWGYALRAQYRSETADDEFRTFVATATGEYLDEDGVTIGPPNYFDPTHFDVNTRGVGVALSYRFGEWMTAALGGDVLSSEITAENTGPRHTSSLTEDRPYSVTQASIVGRLAGALEYGVDARMWDSASEAEWLFTLSAGQSGIPLAGRGDFHTRDERGNQVRGRARWVLGDLEIGGGVTTAFDKVTFNPPSPDEPGVFNRFLSQIYSRGTADTLTLPDSVEFRRDETREWSAGGGVSWRLLGGRALWGAEFTTRQTSLDATALTGTVRSVGFEATTGAEYLCTPVLTGRAGYRFRTADRDDNLALDESKGHALTLGGRYAPIGAIWSFDAGWLLEWLSSDYEDPTGTHGSRQQLAMLFRWTF